MNTGNQLSFTINARNGASAAMTSLQKQVSSLKNGLNSLGSGSRSATAYLNSLNTSAKSSVTGFSKLGSTVKSVIGMFGGFALVNTMINTITGSFDRAIQRADTLDLFAQKMKLITGNASEATSAMEQLKKSTKGTPYALDIAAKAVQNFVTRGMDTQKAVDSVNIWMDAVSAYGNGSNEQFESVMDAIAKMRTKGTVEMRYLNRLFAAGINPVQMYAKATGMAAEDVQTALSEKEIRTEEFLNVVETAMREGTNGVTRIAEAARDMATTWVATVANMTAAIARGILEFMNGIDTIVKHFNADGLKGMVKDFGDTTETVLTKVGSKISTVGKVMEKSYAQVSSKNQSYFDLTTRQLAELSEKTSAHFNSAAAKFRSGFLETISPYIEQAIIKFEGVRYVWAKVTEAFSKGISQISGPLAKLAGEYLGTAITSAEDLAIAFGKWLTLKLPDFFDKLERALTWLTDHKDAVIGAAKAILKALIAFNVLKSIKNVILKFNDSLKGLNDLLAFYTFGKIQIPTLESLAAPAMGASGGGQSGKSSPSMASTAMSNAKQWVGQKMSAKGFLSPSDSFKKIGQYISDSFTYIGQSALASAKGTAHFFKEGALFLGDLASDMFSSFTKGAKNLFGKAKSGAKSAVSGAGSFFGTLFSGFRGLKSGDPFSDDPTLGQSIMGTAKKINSKRPELATDSSLAQTGFFLTDAWRRFKLSKTDDRVQSGLMDFLEGKQASAAAEKVKNVASVPVPAGSSFLKWLNADPEGNPIITKQGVKDFATAPFRAVKWTGQKVGQGAKAIGSGVGNFFGTMFSGMKDLGQGDPLAATTESMTEATTKGGLLTSVIEGLKGAFTGLGSAVSSVWTAITGFVATIAGAVISIAAVAAAIGGLAAALGTLNPDNVLSDKINNFFASFNTWVTTFAETAPTLVQGWVNKFLESLPQLVDQGVNLLLSVVNGILTGIPKVLTVAATVVFSFIQGLVQVLPELVYQGFVAVGKFVAGIIQNIPNVLSAAGELIMTLLTGILRTAPMLIASGIKIVWNIITGIVSMVIEIGKSILNLIVDGVKYVWEHPQEIWEGVKNIATTLWNALLSGLYGAADMFGAGWILDALGAQRPEMAQAGTDAGDEITKGAQDRLDNASLNLSDMFNAVKGEEAAAEAAEAGQNVGDNITAGVDAQLAAEQVDAGQYGADTAAEYTDNLEAGMAATDQVDVTSGIDAQMEQAEADAAQAGTDTASGYIDNMATGITDGSEAVDTAISGVGQEGLANLNVSFSSEQVAQAGAGFINTLNAAINENAFTLYQGIAVICSNMMTQLSAGFANVPEEVPQSIATLMSQVVTNVDAKVREICTSIKTNLTTAKEDADRATQELSTAIQNNFNTAVTSVNASLQQMKTDIEAKYEEIRTCVDEKLTLIEGRQDAFAVDHMDSFRDDIKQRLNETESNYQIFCDNVKGKLDDLVEYHKQAGNDMMNALYDGITSNMGAVTSATSELVTQIKDKFEEGLGIHSPSTYGYWVGQMLAAGLINGLSGSKLTQFVDSVIGDMKTSFENGSFDPSKTVDYLSDQGTLDLIGKVSDIVVNPKDGAVGVPAIVQEALKYVGYHSPGGLDGASIFGARYGNPGAWCASFVRYCAENVGVPFPPTNYVPAVLSWAEANGRSTQTPMPGYAAIFGGGSHIELVADVLPDGTVDMIGGNTGNGDVKHRPRSDATSYVALDGGHSTMTLKDVIQQAYNVKHGIGTSGVSGNVPYDVSAGTSQWAPKVMEALNILGQPASLLGPILATMEAESSGNPNAINLTDDNATLRGTPSKGLMQVIDPTFQQYALPGYNTNIWDPLQNILASLNYQLHSYGGIEAHLHGYAVGTRYVPHDMPAMIHEGEAIIPKSQNPYTNSGGDYLADMFRGAFGESGLGNANFDTSSLNNPSGAMTADNRTSNITFNITNQSDVDGDRFVGNLEMELHRILNDGYRANPI